MKGFNFEKNLSHQTQAVNSTVEVFKNLDCVAPNPLEQNYANPRLDKDAGLTFIENIIKVQGKNRIAEFADHSLRDGQSNIIDIMMETGTGKTYTYTKTIFELNKNYGLNKFIIVVPTLSIKAGTIDFLKSDSAREHFKVNEGYGKVLKLHIVESKKAKNKKNPFPPAVSSFVTAEKFDKNSIQVMVINAGMINSETMQASFDRTLIDKYAVPFDAISAVHPIVILDEPHKFSKSNKTWENIQRMHPQFILRYGATFPEKELKKKNPLTHKVEKVKVKDYHNLIYTLSAVDAFNKNLVKGVIGHVTEFEKGKNALVRLLSTDGKEASFELSENGKKATVKIAQKGSLEKVHSAMTNLFIENLNKTTVVLSNGLEMKKGDKINPFSYAQTVQELMLQKAVKNHFKLEKELLTRETRIKPLSLFFIDNIEEYRGENGYIKKTLEKLIETEAKALLKTEKNAFYKSYLEQTLKDLSLTHGGYFSKDNSEKDEAIEEQVNEILHDKRKLLGLESTRRFIFSKWTLREGWDNPNVFQICKLRSSGSEISKLQEVGRGLRLPVNEYGNRVKEEQFYLNYFVDFTESDFVDQLVNEINEKSGAISMEKVPEKLTDDIINKICEAYNTNEEDLLEVLDKENVINRTNTFKANGFDFIKKNYPLIFEGVGTNKVRKSTDERKQVSVRTEKYQELKELWEKLNQKVILEYKFENEGVFQRLLSEFFISQKNHFMIEGLKGRKAKIKIEDEQAMVEEEPSSAYEDEITPISTMKYSTFIRQLSSELNINLNTIHQSFIESKISINEYLNPSTIRIIKQNFNDFLMYNAMDKFSIDYKKVSNNIHPTKITDRNGNVLSRISASDVGVLYAEQSVADSYFFDELFYDSALEKENIEKEIKEVVVFTKIPKNSIKIPVAGGRTYSPDFAYVLNFNNGGKRLHFIVETKNVAGLHQLRDEERQKIKHAEQFFNGDVKIEFKTQFSNNKILDLIKEITE